MSYRNNDPLGGDLSGHEFNIAVVTGIQTNPVSSTAPTAGQFLIENTSASLSAWTSLSGDVTTILSILKSVFGTP